jgi:hypothetical protein
MSAHIDNWGGQMSEPKSEREILDALVGSVYDVDTCGDITGYDCHWLITGQKAFEKHLRTEHPDGEHR